MSLQRRKLPIGIQTFRKIREGDRFYYVDKTPWIHALVEEGSHFFLSRPRRFGKSLFLDTLKELFEGNEPLFRGLRIHGEWDWSVRYPVVRLSFGGGAFIETGSLHAQPDGATRRGGKADGRRLRVRDCAGAVRPSAGAASRQGGKTPSWCLSTSTTSRSWTLLRFLRLPSRTASTSAASTR